MASACACSSSHSQRSTQPTSRRACCQMRSAAQPSWGSAMTGRPQGCKVGGIGMSGEDRHTSLPCRAGNKQGKIRQRTYFCVTACSVKWLQIWLGACIVFMESTIELGQHLLIVQETQIQLLWTCTHPPMTEESHFHPLLGRPQNIWHDHCREQEQGLGQSLILNLSTYYLFVNFSSSSGFFRCREQNWGFGQGIFWKQGGCQGRGSCCTNKGPSSQGESPIVSV